MGNIAKTRLHFNQSPLKRIVGMWCGWMVVVRVGVKRLQSPLNDVCMWW